MAASSTTSEVVKIKPSDLALLEGKNLIIFEVDVNDPLKNFLTVLERMIVACTDKEFRAPSSINDVPVTTTDDGVYVIEMRGQFKGYVFNNERLMGIKCSNYFAAVQYEGDWHEVVDSKKPIEGAKSLGFKGSYTEFSSSGIRNNKMRYGIEPLMYALIGLLKKIELKPCSEFLTICVNLFECARYPVIGRELIQRKSCLLPKCFIHLIYSWKVLSIEVIDCQNDQDKGLEMATVGMKVLVCCDDGKMRHKIFTVIKKEDVHLLLGMAKCNTSTPNS
ncbi:uncharacterized protein LOC141597407 isoform X2 [Silene latifolia]|uniref:uncharacterized protein LOC141597407 isoform X2 n=1 Tax=Silene latifolia TaxID=37657 RepID=UPI003D77CC35